jgi:hypothetical protein
LSDAELVDGLAARQEEERAMTRNTRLAVGAFVAALAFVAGPTAHAGFVTYSNEAAFNAATSGLTTQNFGMANVAPNTILGFSSPLNSATNNGIFSPGDIVAGLTIGTNQGLQPALAITGVGTTGNTDKTVYANFFSAFLRLDFNPTVGAVGVRLMSFFTTTDFTATVFDSSNTVLGSFTIDDVQRSGSGTFFGIQADAGEQIARIEFSSASGDAEGIAYVAFGPSNRVVNPIPAPAGAVLLAIGAVGLAGGRAIRRKQPAA